MRALKPILLTTYGLAVALIIQFAHLQQTPDTGFSTSSASPSVNERVVLTATALIRTLWAVFDINPLHTPRPLVIVETPTPTNSHQVSQITPTPNATTLPSPSFVVRNGSMRSRNMASERICVTLESHDFWEPGDQADNLIIRLTYGARIIVDGEIILTGDDFIFRSGDILLPIFDESGELLGSHGGPVDVCFNTNGLDVGSHTASIEVRTRSGILHTYSWEFEIMLPELED